MVLTNTRIGETNINKQNLKMTIIEYVTYNKLKVQFEDGFISNYRAYRDFQKGSILNQNYLENISHHNRIGEKIIANNGLECEIIEYFNNSNITVKFSDGNIRYNMSYDKFKAGKISNIQKEDTTNRVGMTNLNNEDYLMKIIRYQKASDIDVEFEDGTIVTNKSYDNFIKGKIRKPYLILGFGKSMSNKNNRLGNYNIKLYGAWRSMIARCYDENELQRFPTYRGCKVCDEWSDYEVFLDWCKDNYYELDEETICLDKDILNKGNKIYSPSTCIFVPKRINNMMTKSNQSRGDYPLGVFYHKASKKFASACTTTSNKIKTHKHLGTFNTPEEAFYAYKTFKENYIKQIADEYKEKYGDKFPQALYDAMYKYEVEITD